MAEVAISLSGGGFRAAMFHLGTLSYLNHLRMPNGRPFLDIVNIISTVSGGSITGLWYLMNYSKGVETDESIRQLYKILNETDIPSKALDLLLAKGNETNSLIKQFEKVYDSLFFHGERFKLLQDVVDNTHIHHYSANGTDFSTGYAFRFQASRKIINAKPEFSRGFVGNWANRIPWDVASDFKLSEILAVSSCFPGAFEPMIYPNDFEISSMTKHKDYIEEVAKSPIHLMDGGIVDNQGIEPIVLANNQMAIDLKPHDGEKCIDLVIVSDVAPSKVTPNTVELPFKLGNITLSDVNWIIDAVIIVLIVLGACFYYHKCRFLLGCDMVLLVDALVLRIATWKIKQKLGKFLVSLPFSSKWGRLLHLPFNSMQEMAESRLSSLVTLAQAVFMKPIRQMRYKDLYEDKGWENRLISNNVSELSSKGAWNYKKGYPEYLKPSELMMRNSDIASSMGTSLWFSSEDKEKGMPEALFAAGQYNLCMNLLEYIERLEADNSNTTSVHQDIISCKKQLMDDWLKFQDAPGFMIS